MKNPETEMAFVTSYEKVIIGNKIHLDTSKDKHKWSCNTYHCLVELVGSKVKCHCPQCEIVRHQINIQLRLLFTWTNQFHHENNQCEDAVWKMCEGIFSLITQSHSNFTKNTAIAMKLMHLIIPQNFSTKERKRRQILKGLALTVLLPLLLLHSQFPRYPKELLYVIRMNVNQ